jgi:hypothetical protein
MWFVHWGETCCPIICPTVPRGSLKEPWGIDKSFPDYSQKLNPEKSVDSKDMVFFVSLTPI